MNEERTVFWLRQTEYITWLFCAAWMKVLLIALV